MSFEQSIPENIRKLRNKIKALEYKRSTLWHECDCKYCEIKGDVPEEHEDQYDAWGEEIQKFIADIKKLESHARLHKIELEQESDE